MKIALIQCPAWGRYNPPFALALLSAYLRCNGKEVYAFDLNNEFFHMLEEEAGSLWQLSNEAFWENKVRMEQFAVDHSELIDSFVDRILNSGCGIIGFSTFNSSKELSLIFARKIKMKDKSKIIIFGGPQAAPHMQGGDIIQHDAVDAIGVGEGEVSLLEFVELAETYAEPRPCKGVWVKKDGKIIQGEERELIPDLNILPFADFSDFSLEGYEQSFKLPVYFSRGCVNRCVYCNENLFWHGHRTRNGERVYEEICFQVNRHKGVYNFEFTDSLVNGNVRELSRLADLLIRNGPKITWGGQAIIRPYMTYELLRRLQRSGCTCLSYGIESGSQQVLNLMRKGFRIEDAERVIQDTYAAGIDAVANFMFGFPGETEEDFNKTKDFLSRNREFISVLNPSLAYTAIGVGTYLYSHAEEYSIDLTRGHLLWESKNGDNTYEIRQRRYRDFCRHAASLGIKFAYPIAATTA